MLLAVIISVLLTIISLVVFVQSPRREANIILVAGIVLINVWLMSVTGLWSEAGRTVEYSRFVFTAGLFAVATMVSLLDAVLREIKRRRRPSYYWLLWLVIVMVGCVTLFTQTVIYDVRLSEGKIPVPIYGSNMLMYLMAVCGILSVLIYLVVTGLRATRGKERGRVKVLSIVLIASVATGMMTNLVLPSLFADTQIAMFAPFTALIMSVGLTYAIVRHGLFDVRLAAVRTLAYGLSVVVMALAYFGLAYITSIAYFKSASTTGVSVSPINIVLALVLAFIFQPIKQFFDHITDRIFFRDRYDVNEFVARLGNVLTSTTRLRTLLDRALIEIARTLKSKGGLMIVYQEDKSSVVIRQNVDSAFTEEQCAQLKAIVSAYGNGALMVDSISLGESQERKMLHLLLRKKGISLVLPLMNGRGLLGYLMLSEHLAGGYTRRDSDALGTISNELVIAIQNARSVQEVGDLNDNLLIRINEATSELRKTNKQLVELDETKDEFVSMASHQLRTPLTSIKGYISMVLEGDAGKVTPMQRKLLGEAFASSERMVHLIADFLNVSRIQTGKFVLEPHQTNLHDLVEEEVASMQQIATAHGVNLICNVSKTFPTLAVDDGKLRQVVMNFIDNAIYYSPEGTPVKVEATIEDGNAVVRVIDSGMGVPKAAQKHLFGKFYRADNARKQRPDGTGVGLFLAKRIIDEHGGSLIFESVEGKGSTFGFRLPITKLADGVS